MIIEPDFLFPLSTFLNALKSAGRGILLIEVTGKDPSPKLCTGWLITDQLVVVPRYAVVAQPDATPSDRYLCWAGEGADLIEAQLVHRPADTNATDPCLLRLDAPQPGCALRLDVANPEPGLRVVVPQHPEGSRETYLSLGRVTEVTEQWIRHDASTRPGSGGAPVLSGDTFGVIGMHVGRSDNADANEAVPLAQVIEELRLSASWAEIAQHQRLADVGAAHRMLADMSATPSQRTAAEPASVGPGAGLLGAALRWTFDPAEFNPEVRARLRPSVGDPDEPRWSLVGDERRRLIRQASSLAELQKVRAPSGGTDPGQRTIDRILDGPDFDLAEVADEDLPYWLQAVGWFADVVPGLPSPSEVNRVLARRRLRGRLSAVAGPKLWGREAELQRLGSWYHDAEPGPMAVTGIGGVGKSALIAQFALDLPSDTVLLWLDFDRADLAPDDAVSVLGALEEQLSAQSDEFTAGPPVDASAWEESADQFGAALARAVTASEAPLLVLDGFEIAQHVERHEEIWMVLGRILAKVPAARVIVSGRAPVPRVNPTGRPGQSMHLDGLATNAARAWLIDQGIEDPAVLTVVLRLSEGVPLRLKMAVRLIDAGEDPRAIPEALSRNLVEGYLYQRILDRVVDWALRPLARDALQLRRLSVEMISSVLGDRVPEGLDAMTVFARLSREFALVEALDTRPAATTTGVDPDPLRLRPEVRAATLRLLELDNVERVREIDRRAAAWYASQDCTDVTVASEIVYHYLRLGNVPRAAGAWLEGCSQFLLDAEQDIPEIFPSARSWLRDRISGTEAQSLLAVAVWEKEAYGRIRSALGRGLRRVVPSILQERQHRSPDSQLTTYDAWVRWQFDDDLEGARAALRAAGSAPGPTGRERAVLGALLSAQVDDQVTADGLLAPYDDLAEWADRPDGVTEALAVRAARVRLSVDLQAELDLSSMLLSGGVADRLREVLCEFLIPGDVLLPSLSQQLERKSSTFQLPPSIPVAQEELGVFARELDAERFRSTQATFPSALFLSPGWATHSGSTMAWTARELGFEPPISADLLPMSLKSGVALGLHLAVLAHRRWEIAANTMFLPDALRPLSRNSIMDTLGFAILCTLAIFHGQPLGYMDNTDNDNLKDLLAEAARRSPVAEPIPLTGRSAVAEAVIGHELPRAFLDSLPRPVSGPTRPLSIQFERLPSVMWLTGENALLLYMLGPDPLEILYRRLLGIPDQAAEGS